MLTSWRTCAQDPLLQPFSPSFVVSIWSNHTCFLNPSVEAETRLLRQHSHTLGRDLANSPHAEPGCHCSRLFAFLILVNRWGILPLYRGSYPVNTPPGPWLFASCSHGWGTLACAPNSTIQFRVVVFMVAVVPHSCILPQERGPWESPTAPICLGLSLNGRVESTSGWT